MAFTGKIAVVTGAGRGIGRSHVEALAAIRHAGGSTHGMVRDVAAVEAATSGIDETRTIEEIDEASFDRMFGVHVKGTFFATRAAVPGMKECGAGKIVVTASTAGMTGDSHYSAAKAALLGLTKASAATPNCRKSPPPSCFWPPRRRVLSPAKSSAPTAVK